MFKIIFSMENKRVNLETTDQFSCISKPRKELFPESSNTGDTRSRMRFRRNGKERESVGWRDGATKSRQKWAPLEGPRAYRALSTKRRTCRYLPSNEDQTPDRAHFVVPGGTLRTWAEVPGSGGYARASCDFSRLPENITARRESGFDKDVGELTDFFYRYLIYPRRVKRQFCAPGFGTCEITTRL